MEAQNDQSNTKNELDVTTRIDEHTPKEPIAKVEDTSNSEEKAPWAFLVPFDDELPHLQLIGDFSAGRSNRCDLRIADKLVSGKHFTITREINVDGTFLPFIYDYSSNGTFLNTVRLERKRKNLLRNFDRINLVDPNAKKHLYTFVDVANSDMTISEKYKVKQVIGSGSFAIVKLGIKVETNEKVAIKIIDKHKFANNAKSRALLDREVDILTHTQHPHIIAIHDVIETDRWLYIVLELATGGDLFDSLRKKACFSESDAKRIFGQVLLALQFLHNTKHTAHRDLKPENILLATEEPDSIVKLTDFGLARIVDASGFMTTICGTPEYVAPEVLTAVGKEDLPIYGLEVDMWSAGAILFTLLSGRLPFEQAQNQDKQVLYQRIMSGSYRFLPESRWANVSAEAIDLIKKLMEVNPKKRLTVNQALEHPWFKSSACLDTNLDIQEELTRKFSKRMFPSFTDSVPAEPKDNAQNELLNGDSHENNHSESDEDEKSFVSSPALGTKRQFVQLSEEEVNESDKKKVKLESNCEQKELNSEAKSEPLLDGDEKQESDASMS